MTRINRETGEEEEYSRQVSSFWAHALVKELGVLVAIFIRFAIIPKAIRERISWNTVLLLPIQNNTKA